MTSTDLEIFGLKFYDAKMGEKCLDSVFKIFFVFLNRTFLFSFGYQDSLT